MNRRDVRRRRNRRIARRRIRRLTEGSGSMGPPRLVEAQPGRLRKTNFRSRFWTDGDIEVPISICRQLVSMEKGEPGSPTGGRSRVKRRGR